MRVRVVQFGRKWVTADITWNSTAGSSTVRQITTKGNNISESVVKLGHSNLEDRQWPLTTYKNDIRKEQEAILSKQYPFSSSLATFSWR